MNRQVLGAATGVLALAAAVAWGIAGTDNRLPSRPPEERPQLALLTSLPIIFGESFGLEGGGSKALQRLEERYQVRPIGVADAASLKGHKLLLMAHPRAQPAEALVELDRWVREGGQVLLLADPKLDWPSERALGDMLRPPPAFADTGLLGHWGLVLAGPDPEGPAMRRGSKGEVMASSPGALSAKSPCAVDEQRFIARCIVGKGRATVIADADFLHVSGIGALDGPTERNLDLLIDELARLESR